MFTFDGHLGVLKKRKGERMENQHSASLAAEDGNS
jgi:hypothetical protein